ncbi:distal-less-like protein [Dinothrombium tinctorium]|uniref:Distal-less-like protein n=1 Tax=Dinothrombium tinctorium TaxID=1965070 RepID=A0A443RIL0_9ACAR|nr:distal-less-like protein [Dinothrombium tinctorium]RWS15088.1 distal-less-like protein [Dinothrombium tinctorium]RWS15092.1 distal-less-like protein [Dinothrombium tinctorium]
MCEHRVRIDAGTVAAFTLMTVVVASAGHSVPVERSTQNAGDLDSDGSSIRVSRPWKGQAKWVFMKLKRKVKIWFQNRRSKYKKMLKAQQQQPPPQAGQANNAQSGAQGASGPGGNTPLHPPASATTPQTPPETPENHTPPSVGPPPLLPVGSIATTPASSGSMSTISPPAMSPPITSWDMGPAKAAAMSNSYIPQYSWYHHGHDPSMNSQLLT